MQNRVSEIQTFLLVGLGNPGSKYERTRHNIGFRVMEVLSEKYQGSWDFEKKLEAECSHIFIDTTRVILIKPQNFMNVSGSAVKKALKWLGITKENMIIVYDDKDMEFGKIRFRESGSSGGHNGIKSIIEYVGSEMFDRLKIGVANEHIQKQDTADFVLGKFTKEEEDQLSGIIVRAIANIENVLIQKNTRS